MVCSCLLLEPADSPSVVPAAAPVLHRKMALRDELKALLVTAETPDEFEKFLIAKKLLQVEQLALMASDEDRLEDLCAIHWELVALWSTLPRGRMVPAIAAPSVRSVLPFGPPPRAYMARGASTACFH